MNCPEKSIIFFHFFLKPGGGWGGSFRGEQIKSPGNIMNCPDNPHKNSKPGGGGGVGWKF